MELSLFIHTLLFIVGFSILIKGADVLVRSASSVARFLNLSEWLIGVVIVGIGTSIPELSINISAALQGTSAGVGALIGSDIFNTLGILGVLAFASPIVLKEHWIKRDIPIFIGMVGITAAVFFLRVGGGAFSGVARLEALILLGVFGLWFFFMVERSDDVADEEESEEVIALPLAFLLLCAGGIGVLLGSHFVVNGAQFFAGLFGVSETLIGVTILAVGTSLPEITVSLRALLRGRPGIAVGNVIGSNIFDLVGIVGITALIRPIVVPDAMSLDMLILLGTAVLLFVMAAFRNPHQELSRFHGALFLVLYVMYLLFVFLRG